MSHIKSISSLSALLLLVLFAAPFAFAQTAIELEAAASVDATVSPSPLPKKPLDALKARAQDIKQKAENAGVELRGDAQVRMNASTSGERNPNARTLKSLILMHGGNIKNRFRLAVSHMNNLLERIDARLDKMAAEGIDTAAAERLKVEADVAVDKAEADATAVADFVATVNESSDRTTVRAELQAKIKTAQESVKAAHAAVMKAVRALVDLAKQNKKGGAGASVEATTTIDVQ